MSTLKVKVDNEWKEVGSTGSVMSALAEQVSVLDAGKADKDELATVATSGSYNDLSDKPTIPAFPSYGTTSSSGGYIKIKINASEQWMTRFTVRIYQNYVGYDISFQGYQYGSNYWYSPQARMIAGTGNSLTVYFGYDSVGALWVAFPADSYTAVSVTDVVNGYRQVTDFSGKFTIEQVSSLSGTIQASQTVYRPWVIGDKVTGAVFN